MAKANGTLIIKNIMEIIGLIVLIAVIIYALGLAATNKNNRSYQLIFKRGFFITLGLAILAGLGVGGFHLWLENRPETKVVSLEIFNSPDNRDGYTIMLKGVYDNLRDETCQVKTCFFTNNGKPIPSNDGNYEYEGQACVQEELNVLLDHFANTQTLFIPYNEIGLTAQSSETPFFSITTISNNNKVIYEELRELKFPMKRKLEQPVFE